MKNIGASDGLTNTSITSIVEDKYGFMWFGTEIGLIRYDGSNFIEYTVNFNDSTSITDNKIRTLFKDNDDNIWIGTLGGGLNLYNYENDQFIHFIHNPDDSASISNNLVNTIVEDQEGFLWIGTENGLNKFDKRTRTFEQFYNNPKDQNSLSSNSVLALMVDNNNTLWVGGWKSTLQRFSPSTNTFENIILNTPAEPTHIWKIVLLENGSIAIGTYGQGLFIFDSDSKKTDHYTDSRIPNKGLTNNIVRAIIELDNNILLCGTEKGLTALDLNTRESSKFDNSYGDGLNVWDFCKSKSGIVWMAKALYGITYYCPHKNKFQLVNIQKQANLCENNVLSFTEDFKGNIWIGTGDGLNKITTNGEFQKIKLPIDEEKYAYINVYSLTTDRTGFIWAGLFQGIGLLKIDPETNKVVSKRKIPLDNISAILQDRWGVLWIGGLNSLCYINPANDSLVIFKTNPSDQTSIGEGLVNCIFEKSDGTLWVGTGGGGLCKFDRNSSVFERFNVQINDHNSISSNTIFSMDEDESGNLWIATSAGLNKYNAQHNSFEVFGKSTGFPTNQIYSVLIDENNTVWMSSNRGLFMFNENTGEVMRYDTEDGLQDLVFNANSKLRSSDNTLFFGGNKGFNNFKNKDLYKNKFVSQPVLTNLRINNKIIKPGKNNTLKKQLTEAQEIYIPFKQKVFSIEYISPVFTNSSKYQYAYKLEGFDDSYHYVGNQKNATYTNLAPGIYEFKLIAANNDNVWTENPTVLKIRILAPFYKTLIFKIFVAILLAGLLVLFFILRQNYLFKRKIVLEKMVHQKTVELEIVNQKLQTKTYDLVQATRSLQNSNQQLKSQKGDLEIKANQIEELNKKITNENIQLVSNVNQLLTDKIIQKKFSFSEFETVFKDDTECYRFLDELKWKEEFKCKKCSESTYKYITSDSHIPFSRRCSFCQHIESPMVGTIFYRLKFPIQKAFYILFITLNGKQQTLESLAGEISLRKQTCWSFQQKVKNKMSKLKRAKQNTSKLDRVILD
ncbi:MAG: two-component regulator propeller domain-containing protein [Prolixibacteraceae bacterium]